MHADAAARASPQENEIPLPLDLSYRATSFLCAFTLQASARRGRHVIMDDVIGRWDS